MSGQIKIWTWSLLLIGVAGCDAFLDEPPDNRVTLDNLEKASQLLTNGYSVASPAFTDYMTDNVTFTQGTTIRQNHEQLFSWTDGTTGPDEQDSPEFFWNETYNAIAHANEVLAVINDIPTTTEEERAHKDAIKGEARLIRAYGHFMLVNVFAPHYDPDNADTDLGIPYIKTPETTFLAKYERNTVAEVYEEIEDDLLRGLDLVNDNFYSNSGKYHFNRNAALAFASRFYLYRAADANDIQSCIRYSDQLLGSDPGSFVRDMTTDEFRNAKSSIDAYPQLYNSPDLQSNLLLMRKITLTHVPFFGHGIGRNEHSDLFALNPFTGSTDERENPALQMGINAVLPLRYEILFQRSSLNSNTGLYYCIAPIFRGEEVLLNRIEANTYFGNNTRAIADLQVFVERRYRGDDINITMERLRSWFGAENDPDFTDFLILLNFVILERQKEFLLQGMRWFDIKRFGFEVVHITPTEGAILLEADDPRKALQIPQSAIDVGGLEPNAR
ncbi:MAG: RagB/SusD family nutrient uptake outer membrane protein [Cyclobacteriaceae bacterium]